MIQFLKPGWLRVTSAALAVGLVATAGIGKAVQGEVTGYSAFKQ